MGGDIIERALLLTRAGGRAAVVRHHNLVAVEEGVVTVDRTQMLVTTPKTISRSTIMSLSVTSRSVWKKDE